MADLAQSLDYVEPEEGETPPMLSVPQSQILFFTSPLPWAKVLKLEYEKVGKGEKRARDDDYGAEAEEEPEADEDEQEITMEKTVAYPSIFPIRTFEFIFTNDLADLKSLLKVKQYETKLFTGF
jgi:hypothetical protein